MGRIDERLSELGIELPQLAVASPEELLFVRFEQLDDGGFLHAPLEIR